MNKTLKKRCLDYHLTGSSYQDEIYGELSYSTLFSQKKLRIEFSIVSLLCTCEKEALCDCDEDACNEFDSWSEYWNATHEIYEFTYSKYIKLINDKNNRKVY